MTKINLRKVETNDFAFEITRGYVLVGPGASIRTMLQ
jgi:hypothetical protein